MSSTTPPGFLVAGGGTGAVGFAGGVAGAAFPAGGAGTVGLTGCTVVTVGLTRGPAALVVVAGLPTVAAGNVLAPFVAVVGTLVAFPGCFMAGLAGDAPLGAWVLGCANDGGCGVVLRLGVVEALAGLATRDRSILK